MSSIPLGSNVKLRPNKKAQFAPSMTTGRFDGSKSGYLYDKTSTGAAKGMIGDAPALFLGEGARAE
jgi:hypothetical protein